jgi:hypothetical protein
VRHRQLTERETRDLSAALAPATVAQCHGLLSAVLRSAVRDRVIPSNPCEGFRLPRQRRTADHDVTISREAFLGMLLPAIPDRWRALVGLAGGTGLRWESARACAGMPSTRTPPLVYVTRVAVEVAGHVADKPIAKSKTGRRIVPLPAFAIELPRQHQARYEPGPAGQVSRTKRAVRHDARCSGPGSGVPLSSVPASSAPPSRSGRGGGRRAGRLLTARPAPRTASVNVKLSP